MQRELTPSPSLFREFGTKGLRSPFHVANPSLRLRVEPDSSVAWVLSARSRKLIFGRSTVELYKLSAGLRVPLPRKEMRLRLMPSRAQFSALGGEPLGLTQSILLCDGSSVGYLRRIRLSNQGQAPMHLRVMTSHDPTGLNFRRDNDPPAEIGVNAFNRGGHVVMDDAGDTTGVRIIGCNPAPSLVFMTKDRQRASELISEGELPDKTEGMSGAILILTQSDFELPPRSSAELTVTSLYHPSKLEEALVQYVNLTKAGPERDETWFDQVATLRSSTPSLNSSFAWAKASLLSLPQEEDLLDSLCAEFARGALLESEPSRAYNKYLGRQRKDGLLAHSQDAAEPGVLETAAFIISCAQQLQLSRNKKLSREMYRPLVKAADSLSRLLVDGLVSTNPLLPQGWRRRLKSGFPTGILTEINLVVARALRDVASLAYGHGKGVDAARYREASETVLAAVLRRLKDRETGTLMLSVDPNGKMHKETTVDQAVAFSYLIPDENTASSLVHRLLERDFETGYGPRCVPSSNPIYYNTSYGEGQLGGYWTRAALAHAILAYQCGHAGIGSMQLEKVARLVDGESEKLGGIPGEFPFYIDPDRRVVSRGGSDTVAAARFFEAVVFGELGVSMRAGQLVLQPPKSSGIRWLSVHGLRLGAPISVFVGRAANSRYVAASSQQPSEEVTFVFRECERLPQPSSGSEVLLFHTPHQLLCVGSSSPNPQSILVNVPLRDKELGGLLKAELEELEPESGKWRRTGGVSLTATMAVKVDLKPFGWKFLKFSQIT